MDDSATKLPHIAHRPAITALTLIISIGGNMPPVHVCLWITKTARVTAIRGLFGHWPVLQPLFIAVLHVISVTSPGNVNMVALKPEIHFRKSSQRRLPLDLRITSNICSHFHRLLSFFHGHLTWICCWCGFCQSSPEMQYGWRIEFKNGQKNVIWSTSTKNMQALVSCTCFVYSWLYNYTVSSGVTISKDGA